MVTGLVAGAYSLVRLALLLASILAIMLVKTLAFRVSSFKATVGVKSSTDLHSTTAIA